jgi:hypothetical protein
MARARDRQGRGRRASARGRAEPSGSSPFEPVPPAEKAAVARNRALEAPEDFARRRGAGATPTRPAPRRGRRAPPGGTAGPARRRGPSAASDTRR